MNAYLLLWRYSIIWLIGTHLMMIPNYIGIHFYTMQIQPLNMPLTSRVSFLADDQDSKFQEIFANMFFYRATHSLTHMHISAHTHTHTHTHNGSVSNAVASAWSIINAM